MAQLWIALTLAAGLVKGWSSKKAGTLTSTVRDGVAVNLVRMVLCTVIGAGVMLVRGGMQTGAGVPWVYAASAVCMSAFAVSWLLAVKLETYMFLSICTMLGSMVSTLCSAAVYGEAISFLQGAGMLLLLLATYVMSLYNRDIKGKVTPAGLAALIVCGLSSGMSEFCQKIYMKENGVSVDTFNFLTYLLAAVLLTAVLFFLRGKSDAEAPARFKKAAGYIALMSFCLYLNSFAKTSAAGLLPANQLYPVTQGLNLICSTVMARVCFGEAIKKRSVIGITLCFAALILINFG